MKHYLSVQTSSQYVVGELVVLKLDMLPVGTINALRVHNVNIQSGVDNFDSAILMKLHRTTMNAVELSGGFPVVAMTHPTAVTTTAHYHHAVDNPTVLLSGFLNELVFSFTKSDGTIVSISGFLTAVFNLQAAQQAVVTATAAVAATTAALLAPAGNQALLDDITNAQDALDGNPGNQGLIDALADAVAAFNAVAGNADLLNARNAATTAETAAIAARAAAQVDFNESLFFVSFILELEIS